MAAIIAQMTRANRERKRKKRYEISKCMYELPPFTDRFEKQLHNKYLRAKTDMQDKLNAESFHKDVLNRLEELKAEEEENRRFRMKTCALESAIIGSSLLLVPACVLLVLLFWPETPVRIPVPPSIVM